MVGLVGPVDFSLLQISDEVENRQAPDAQTQTIETYVLGGRRKYPSASSIWRTNTNRPTRTLAMPMGVPELLGRRGDHLVRRRRKEPGLAFALDQRATRPMQSAERSPVRARGRPSRAVPFYERAAGLLPIGRSARRGARGRARTPPSFVASSTDDFRLNRFAPRACPSPSKTGTRRGVKFAPSRSFLGRHADTSGRLGQVGPAAAESVPRRLLQTGSPNLEASHCA